jgi:hypothetical protein
MDFFVEILTPGMMNASQLYLVCKKAFFSLLKTVIQRLVKILQDPLHSRQMILIEARLDTLMSG